MAVVRETPFTLPMTLYGALIPFVRAVLFCQEHEYPAVFGNDLGYQIFFSAAVGICREGDLLSFYRVVVIQPMSLKVAPRERIVTAAILGLTGVLLDEVDIPLHFPQKASW